MPSFPQSSSSAPHTSCNLVHSRAILTTSVPSSSRFWKRSKQLFSPPSALKRLSTFNLLPNRSSSTLASNPSLLSSSCDLSPNSNSPPTPSTASSCTTNTSVTSQTSSSSSPLNSGFFELPKPCYQRISIVRSISLGNLFSSSLNAAGPSSIQSETFRPPSTAVLLSASDRKSRHKSWFSATWNFNSAQKPTQSLNDTLKCPWKLNLSPSSSPYESTSPLPYNVYLLTQCQKVNELWLDDADTLVYLSSPSSHLPPSFKLHSSLIRHSRTLSALLSATHDSAQLYHVYLSLDLRVFQAAAADHVTLAYENDIETLVAIRNLFAFLNDRFFVATRQNPTLVHIFAKLSHSLDAYHFIQHSSPQCFTPIVDTKFNAFVERLGLGDPNADVETVVQGLILGECMRNAQFYLYCFSRVVGMYGDNVRINLAEYEEYVSWRTRERIERAVMDLESRVRLVHDKLLEFHFPYVFSGLMSSKTSIECKFVRFDVWKQGFLVARRITLNHVRRRYGSWPPKAGRKKVKLETSGLNRVVLKQVYDEFCQLYDLYVDRSNVSPRAIPRYRKPERCTERSHEFTIQTLRCVLAETDNSLPPVLPAIPFDVPILPDLNSSMMKISLKSFNVDTVISSTYNTDCPTIGSASSLVSQFRQAERKSWAGRSIQFAQSFRIGIWLFIYSVMQSLPILVVDAPLIDATEVSQCEHFLCMFPRNGLPWKNGNTTKDCNERFDQPRSKRTSYQSSVHSLLPSANDSNSVESIYKRSYAWKRSVEWLQQLNSPVPTPLKFKPSFASSYRPQSFCDFPFTFPSPLLYPQDADLNTDLSIDLPYSLEPNSERQLVATPN